jgi:hypothetical protein
MKLPLAILEITTTHVTQHPFVLSLGGLVFWFALKYSIAKNKKRVKNFRHYLKESADEILVSSIGGLCFIVFDDEILLLINHYLNYDVPIEVHNALYLLGPLGIDRLYKLMP